MTYNGRQKKWCIHIVYDVAFTSDMLDNQFSRNMTPMISVLTLSTVYRNLYKKCCYCSITPSVHHICFGFRQQGSTRINSLIVNNASFLKKRLFLLLKLTCRHMVPFLLTFYVPNLRSRTLKMTSLVS